MRDFIKKKFKIFTKIIRNTKIKKRAYDDYILFKKNWLYSKPNVNKIGYEIILEEHSLEKGMTSKKPRYFGINKVKNIIRCLNLYDSKNWKKDFAYNLGLSILFEYCDYYKKQNWDNREEYTLVSNYLKDKKQEIKSGVFEINKKEINKHLNIDYNDFLSSRHSFREFEEKQIDDVDIKKAINMTLKTPTACNRQMCKIYYIKSKDVKNIIIKYSHGLTNFNNDTVNIFIITYDICSLCVPGELNQGMFNSGLVSMNFVNSLHSLGIGSCFLEYSNGKKEEEEMKKILNIPNNEKVAIVIAAGYYPEKSLIPCSTRKPIEEIYRER